MSHRIRIAVVNYAFAGDVADPERLLERYTSLTGWSEAVSAAGGDVFVVQRFHRDGRVVRTGIEYLFCRDGPDGRTRSRLWPRRVHRAVAARRPDVVHVNDLNAAVQTWLLRRALPKSSAIVVQDHGGRPVAPRSDGGGRNLLATVRAAVKRTALGSADGFFFTAAPLAEACPRARLTGDRRPVYEVLEASTALRPVDRAVARQRTGLHGDPALLWVGRLNANKAPLVVLDGFERSLARLPAAGLSMIYGTDDLLPAVKRRIEASPALAGRVRLVGAVPHDRMAAYYSAADLFVVGSHHEGSGYAVVEACACGLPPIVTDIPAFRAITGNGAVGALWPPDDAAALARALVDAAGADREAHRRRVLDRFDRALSWPVVGQAALDAYAAALAVRRARR